MGGGPEPTNYSIISLIFVYSADLKANKVSHLCPFRTTFYAAWVHLVKMRFLISVLLQSVLIRSVYGSLLGVFAWITALFWIYCHMLHLWISPKAISRCFHLKHDLCLRKQGRYRLRNPHLLREFLHSAVFPFEPTRPNKPCQHELIAVVFRAKGDLQAAACQKTLH